MSRKSNIVSAKSLMNKQHLELQQVEPLTDTQSQFFENYDTGKSQVLSGANGGNGPRN